MAWQLIYTSAPRSLEAGRSGFGTVARHRTISPLLVSAIERTSQFSRLPGVDTGRVIFCYRIVAVAGGRFHVLSSIRDAGADYTGRTNHIAHHLIADPREIAQLGANGPSPADVLLAMQWATSWTEQPRFFEATEEIALATIRPTNSSAWQRITGSPEQAWLLASGDASRGAYVIQPAGTDLRTVFAESLRLIPERLWQISFTTSLQPSDEPADFRWIGIEERSPLRAQTESSGRPTLNLAAPDTLPLVEVAQPAAASQIRQSFTQTSAQSSPEGRTVSPSAKSLTPRRTANERAVEMQSTATTAATHSHRKWWLMAGGIAVIVASVVAFFVGRPLYVKYEHNKAVRAEIDSILNRSEFFSGEVRMELKRAEAADLAKELAEAADRSWRVAKEADFAAMLRVPDKALRERARNANLNTPAEINALDERLEKIATIYQWLHDFQPQPEDDNALDEIKKRRSEADQLTSPTPKTNTFDKIKGVIGSLAEKRRAQVIFSLLNNVPIKRPQPDQSIAWFDEALRAIAPASEDEETKLILKAAQQLIDDWKFADAQETTKVLTDLEQRLAQRPDWPAWLKAKAQLKIAIARTGKVPVSNESVPRMVPNAPTTSSPPPDKPTPLPRVPLYFVIGKDSLSKCRIDELGPNLKFSLKLGPNGDTVALGDLNKNGTLRRSVAGDPDFEVKEDQKIIGAAKGAAALTLPFALSAKDAMGTEVFQLWVVSASSEPLFGVKTSGLKNDGTKVSVDPVTAPLPGATRASLYLETPSDFLPGSKISEYKLSNLSLELVKIIAPIQQERQTYIKQRDAVTPPTEQSLFDEFTAEAQTFLSKDGLSRLTGIATNPRHKLCGAMLRAFSDDWEQLGLSTAKAIPNRDAVFAKGTILLDEQLGKQKADEVEKAIKDALLFVRGITKHEKLSGPDKVKVRKLTALENMIVLAGADAEEAKTLLAQRIKYADQQRERADKKVKDIDSLPLLNRAIPPGKYRLLVGIGSSDSIGSGTETKIPLWDFTIQIPDSLK